VQKIAKITSLSTLDINPDLNPGEMS
jgi:hypothetical protein